ncbi:CTP synthetase [Halorubrum rubrum]|uniref:CTP synthetase n=1 Tax=Halorubrum rubrum TaxID=1126240 RepID=A0ABD5R052_9EURY|nr:CTP synthetase [Halorubrum rubrum]
MAGNALTAIVAGPDEHGIGEELEALDATVSRVEGVVSADALKAAGITEADYLVLTDADEATGIPVAKELNPSVTVVTYADRSLPEFVAGVADLAVDPALVTPTLLAEELAAGGPAAGGDENTSDDETADATAGDGDADDGDE